MNHDQNCSILMTDEIKDILFTALQNSYVDSVIIHKIDSENSAIEMDYEAIACAVLKALSDNNYNVVKVFDNQR